MQNIILSSLLLEAQLQFVESLQAFLYPLCVRAWGPILSGMGKKRAGWHLVSVIYVCEV